MFWNSRRELKKFLVFQKSHNHGIQSNSHSYSSSCEGQKTHTHKSSADVSKYFIIDRSFVMKFVVTTIRFSRALLPFQTPAAVQRIKDLLIGKPEYVSISLDTALLI